MAPLVHEFDWPDRAVVGTIGPPGDRTFYLQVRAGRRLASVVLEKQQSALLAEKIEEILDQLRAVEGNPASVPASTPPELVDNDGLEPDQDLFRIGTMGLGWDPATAQIVIEAHPVIDADDEDPTPDDEDTTDVLRVRMPVGAARAFARRTREVVAAGRPACPLCGHPVDPDGHVCPDPED
ncbi:DUF3090 family protein [Litorihabitans aurantiacus]|uniref:DUF3090 domain-containing protein n=1 Tax=Litorihabitans aurantiacus TaxID=1930061 RepID=A0AA37UH49_9MICO|nr:DUF3090 family protein [Litorihabitans aurantiacus]GMA30558.1 hypothetical protein GCM10025875_05500 [Litorihabitans aurantiacus]